MEVDAGATVTVIPTEVYEKASGHVQLSPSSVRLQTYSGEPLQVRREASVPVRYEGQYAVLKIVLMDVTNKPAILGIKKLAEGNKCGFKLIIQGRDG
jgi:hypothetical protein